MKITRGQTTVLMVLILALALFVRAYGLGFPQYHWDENIGFTNVFYASFNHLALLTYVHGSFYQYLILVVWDIYLVLKGIFPTTQNLLLAFFRAPTPFLILARNLIVLASLGSIGFAFLLGRRLYNPRVGLVAAFFLSLTFLQAAESHYARSHILSGFFVLAVVYYCARLMESGRRGDYILAGISLGLATAAQYSAILAVLPLFLAHLFSCLKQKPATWKGIFLNRSFIFSLDLAAAAFFIVTPYALLDFRHFAGELKWFLTQVISHPWVSPEGQPIWLFYLSEHLRNGLGTGLALVSVIGVLYAIFRHTRRDAVLLAFPLALYISLWKGENFARYLLPILPFLAIAAARLLDDISAALEKRYVRPAQAFLILSVIALIVPSTVNILRFDYWITQPDTRQIAAQWITAHIPDGSTVVIEGGGVLGPTIPISRTGINLVLANEKPGTIGYVYLQSIRDTQPPGPAYYVTTVFRLDQVEEGGIVVGSINSAGDYADRGQDYLVTVNWMQRGPGDSYMPGFQKTITDYYEPIMEFKPSVEFRFDPYAWRMDYPALARVIPGRPGVGGPDLVIYRRKGIGQAQNR